ncbi:GNAT family N-acetyltransferase [Falsochrobactrum sp. TDYN1]|uniref:GNAT family N-acetyltransferase n=1 Tax=Falsochrobactrum tianjinense TaxID=2706015 RepID=A0A949UUA9_9HYPH|nr:GNAT family N-acetyltransferase [Falsochrobactrum sp. TDYN1]MBV2142903.1 GNAT family N-acetyltransferase [Falsochrobactrum sp. TDYN1]
MWVRSASEADLQAVHELLVETWHATFDDILGRDMVTAITSQWHSIAALKANLRKPYSEFVVANNSKGGIDGMAFAKQADKNKVSLHQLYVRPEAQVHGIGTMLLAEVEIAFPDVSAIRLEVIERNNKAVLFYEHKGYVRIGRNEDWGAPTCKEPVLVMEKKLEGWSM